MPAAARVNRVYQSWPSSCEPGFSSNSIASVRSAAVPAASSISAVLVVVISCSFFLRSSYCTSEIMRGSAAESASSAVHARLRQESVEHDGDDKVEQDDLRKTTGWCKRVQTNAGGTCAESMPIGSCPQRRRRSGHVEPARLGGPKALGRTTAMR